MMIKTCKRCGKEFETNTNKRVYCSHECYKMVGNECRAKLAREYYKAKKHKQLAPYVDDIIKLAKQPDCDNLITEYLIEKFNIGEKK